MSKTVKIKIINVVALVSIILVVNSKGIMRNNKLKIDSRLIKVCDYVIKIVDLCILFISIKQNNYKGLVNEILIRIVVKDN